MVVNLKEEEMMLGVYDEHNRQQKRKIDHMKNFVEFKCKVKHERVDYAKEVLEQQQKYREDLMKKVQNLHISTKEPESSVIMPYSNEPKNSQAIKIDDDQDNPSPVNEGIRIASYFRRYNL